MLDTMGILEIIERALSAHKDEKNKEIDAAFNKSQLTGDTGDIDSLTNELPAATDDTPPSQKA